MGIVSTLLENLKGILEGMVEDLDVLFYHNILLIHLGIKE